MIQTIKFEPKSIYKLNDQHKNWRETTTSETNSTQNKKYQPFSKIYHIKTQVSRFEYNSEDKQNLKDFKQRSIEIEQQRSICIQILSSSKQKWDLKNKLDFIPDLALKNKFSQTKSDEISRKFQNINLAKAISNRIKARDLNNQQNHCVLPTPFGFDTSRSRIIVGKRNVLQYLNCSVDSFKLKIQHFRSLPSPERQNITKNRDVNLINSDLYIEFSNILLISEDYSKPAKLNCAIINNNFRMFKRLLAGQSLDPKMISRLKYFSFIFAGGWLGFLSGKIDWQDKKEFLQADKMTTYQCEDQINRLIQSNKKPAVIYYYLPAYPNHHLIRKYMLKYSNMYPENAIWVMVNLTQNLEQAKEALKTVVFPDTSIRVEVRFPQQDIAIFQADPKQGLKLIRQTHSQRREVYNYNPFQEQFQAFLEENKIIKGQDPVDPTLRITEAALFRKDV